MAGNHIGKENVRARSNRLIDMREAGGYGMSFLCAFSFFTVIGNAPARVETDDRGINSRITSFSLIRVVKWVIM